jgi:hypothetical protein
MTDAPLDPSPLPGPVDLSLLEQRVLGALVEKQKTTADAYPMSVNALVAASNQKSNRDPVLSVTDDAVEATLEALNQRNLVVRVVSGRVDKWKHVLYEHWKVDRVELAVLAELFLRGPQTEGELRGHVSRMDPVDDLDAMRAIVRRLADRGMVVYLTEEGRRGTVVTHGFQDAAALDRARAGQADVESNPAARVSPSPATGASRPPAGAADVDALRKELTDLRLTVGVLAARLQSLCDQLGVPLPPAPAP